MKRFIKFTLWVSILSTGGTALAASDLDIGRPASAQYIAGMDIDIMPDGHGLGPGRGSVADGRALWGEQCAACHGEHAEGGSAGALSGGASTDPTELANDRSLLKTIGNYWPYATTLYDYIRRAMPFDRPGSLDDQQVYALTAYLLFLNGIVDEETTLDAQNLPTVQMPARPYFVTDNRSSDELQ